MAKLIPVDRRMKDPFHVTIEKHGRTFIVGYWYDVDKRMEAITNELPMIQIVKWIVDHEFWKV